MSEQSIPDPQGTVAILVDGGGRVVATAANFERTTYGGMDIREAQKWRAQNDLVLKFTRDHSSDDIGAVISLDIANDIVRALIKQKNYNIIYAEIGYASTLQ